MHFVRTWNKLYDEKMAVHQLFSAENFESLARVIDIRKEIQTSENNIQKITFNPYNLSSLPNSLYVTEQSINSIKYYVLTVIHPNNFVDIGDTITISNSNDVNVIDNVIKNSNITDTDQQYLVIINNSYINKDHIIYDINLKKSTYDIILGKTSNITLTVIPISNVQSSSTITSTI